MKIDFGMRYIILLLLLMLSLVLIDEYYDFPSRWRYALWGLMGAVSVSVVQFIEKRLRSYVPVSVTDAKICNEKIKLFAGLFNTLAILIIAGGVARPMLEKNFDMLSGGNLLLILMGALMHAVAQRILSTMKDETKGG